jgi:hypothetical protein
MIRDNLYNGGSGMKIGLIGFGAMEKTHTYAVQNAIFLPRAFADLRD